MNTAKFLRTMFAAAAMITPLSAQQFVSAVAPDVATPAPSSVATSQSSSAVVVPSWEKQFDRWVDLKDLNFSLRYRSVFDSNNAHDFNQAQNRSILDGKFKFDEQGKYGIFFHGSTGHYFNWAYADFMGGGEKQALQRDEAKATPLQKLIYRISSASAGSNLTALQASGGWSFYMRRLYLDGEPVKGLEAQYGSLDINRGVASEITTYDNDGYIDGERVMLKRPSKYFPDEVSVTYAYLGDLFVPNFFARGKRLAQNNYHQFLVRKAYAKKRVDSSFDYSWQNHAQILHEAILVNLPESRILDSARIETYQRLDKICYTPTSTFCFDGATGYAITLDKKLKRVSLEGGYASIDDFSGVLTQLGIVGIVGMDTNGDQYGIGKRGFGRATIKLTPYLDAFGFYTHMTHPTDDVALLIWNKQALNAGLVFDMKKAFFHEKQIK